MEQLIEGNFNHSLVKGSLSVSIGEENRVRSLLHYTKDTGIPGECTPSAVLGYETT